jgi:hypothetical protein
MDRSRLAIWLLYLLIFFSVLVVKFSGSVVFEERKSEILFGLFFLWIFIAIINFFRGEKTS